MKYGDKGLKQKEAKAAAKEGEQSFKSYREKKIDYVDIINHMGEEAFDVCVEKLYPLLDYCVLTKKDIRRVDLEEQLIRLQNWFCENNKGKNIGFLNYYLKILKDYYNKLVNCEEGSRASLCRNRGDEVMNRALSNEGSLADIEDSIIILLCLLREKSVLQSTDEKISDVTISLTMSDFDIIDALIELKIQPSGAVMKKPGILDKIISSHDNDEFDAKIMYINSVLFLCMGLQDRGLIG